MKTQYIMFLLLALGAANAITIPNGECQNFTLYDNATNTTNITEICAGNATIVYNITNVTNITVVQCNATTVTMWANSTETINNATVTCMSNWGNTTIYQTEIRNVSVCNFTDTIIPDANDHILQNVSGLNVRIYAIPTNYCHENIYRNPLDYGESILSSKCNISVIAPLNLSMSCQPPTVCPVCAACQCDACPTVQNTTCPEPGACGTNCTEEINATSANLLIQIAGQSNIIQGQQEEIGRLSLENTLRQNVSGGIKSAVEEEANARMGWFPFVLLGGIFACFIVIVGFIIIKVRQRQAAPTEHLPSALSQLEKAVIENAGNEGNPWERKKEG